MTDKDTLILRTEHDTRITCIQDPNTGGIELHFEDIEDIEKGLAMPLVERLNKEDAAKLGAWLLDIDKVLDEVKALKEAG